MHVSVDMALWTNALTNQLGPQAECSEVAGGVTCGDKPARDVRLSAAAAAAAAMKG